MKLFLALFATGKRFERIKVEVDDTASDRSQSGRWPTYRGQLTGTYSSIFTQNRPNLFELTLF